MTADVFMYNNPIHIYADLHVLIMVEQKLNST